jgi:hypothetical protein
VVYFERKSMLSPKKNRAITAIGMCAFVLAPLQAVQAEPASGRIGVSGFVSVICRAELSGGILPTSDRVSLGRLTELCNTSQGYRVIMSYPAALEGATLFVDGAPVTLTASGQTIVTDSTMAAYKVRTLELDISALSADARSNSLSVFFSAVPRGGI